ncbi:hypothetical protein FACS1894147_08480 [Spirochaetia bacterium]|nr:hypothetical protein FACS1894147_08480 [Spirochaetia bacterium]
MKMQMGTSLWKNIGKSLGTRYVKYGGFAAVITVAVIAAVIFLNLIVQQFSPQFDLTEEKIFSLSDQSRQILASVKDPVKIYGIWAPGNDNPDAREIAELYTARSSLVSFEAIDPDLHPGLMQRFDRDGNGVQRGSLVVEGARGFRPIAPGDMYDYYTNQQGQRQPMGIAIEKRISSALIYVSTGESPVVYEITGHGEYPLEAFRLKEKIEQENYVVKDINLFQSEVPDDASVLILNNPESDLSSGEAEKILAYLENGGRLLVLMDFNSGAIDSVNGMLASYGIRFDKGVVVESDLSHMAGRNNFVLIPDMLPHDISQPLIDKGSRVVIQFAMGISVLDMRRRTVKTVPYLQSSNGSFLRTDLLNTNPEQTAGDIAGPLVVAAAVMDPEYAQDGETQARIAAIGGETLLAYVELNPANMDLFMNSLNWIEDRPQSLTVESRSLFQMPLRITFVHVLAFGLLFVIIIPLTLFILALVTWLKRRHL